jgi:hypothetical protein
MRLNPQLPLPLSVIILIASGSLSAAQSQTTNPGQPNPEVERCIRDRVVYEQPLSVADACSEAGAAVISTDFLYDLLTRPPEGRYGALAGIWISNVTIVGDMKFTYRNASYDLKLEDCQFLGNLAFNDTRFEKNFSLARSTFVQRVDFSRMEVVRDFDGSGCHFNFIDPNKTNFGAIFTNAQARNVFLKDAHFPGGVYLYDLNISGNLLLHGLQVKGSFSLSRTVIKGNLVLIDAHILGKAGKDFSVTTTDNLIFVKNEIDRPYTLNGLTFRLLFAPPDEMLNFVEGADYRPIDNDVYQHLENFYRQRDSLVNAKAVHVAWKKRERSTLASQSDFRSRLYFGLNWLHYISTGYSQHFELALLWSTGFIVIGYFVFRKKEWMEYTGKDDVWPLRYHPWWYSIALFLPIVSLQDKERWTPRADRRKSRIYMRLHIILGYLLIPIGLAAVTGLIK